MLNNCEAKGLGCVLTLPIYRGREQHGNGREAGDKGTGSGRVRYGRREVLTPLSPPTFQFHMYIRNGYPLSVVAVGLLCRFLIFMFSIAGFHLRDQLPWSAAKTDKGSCL